jgi:outer membrane protein OmpA-like peptidoglycan-associated protein
MLALASASAQDAVLQGKQVTESALVDALAIDSPADAASGPMRGFRPSAQTPSGRPAKAGPGKTSLLITFLPDSATLMSEAKATLDTVAKALQSDRLAGFTFKVEGHADPRGSSDHNLKLSQQRATAVVDYLTKERGVLPERLAPEGKGSAEPLNTARPEAPENRRVTIVTNRN